MNEHSRSMDTTTGPIAVTGAGGQLGSELCRRLPGAVPLDFPDFDLAKPDLVREVLRGIRPSVLINAAAYTAVDRAEDEPQKCFAVNSEAVSLLAETTAHLGCRLVQISTDYVFGGSVSSRVPYGEDATPEPQGVYARSKLAGEQHALRNPRHLIIRTCGLYGRPGPTSASNFVATMLRVGSQRQRVSVVDDQSCSPTWVVELTRALLYLLAAQQNGLFHVVAGGQTTWCNFARTIFQLAQLSCQVDPISTEEYGLAAARPCYSVLSTAKYHSAGGPPLLSWDAALEGFLQQYVPEAE